MRKHDFPFFITNFKILVLLLFWHFSLYCLNFLLVLEAKTPSIVCDIYSAVWPRGTRLETLLVFSKLKPKINRQIQHKISRSTRLSFYSQRPFSICCCSLCLRISVRFCF